MKNIVFLALLFPLITQASISLVGKGHIADESIEMHLNITDEGEATGDYFYTKTKTLIKLKGNLVEREITLKTVGDPKTKESFKGKVIIFDGEISRITGKWFDDFGKNSNGYDFKVDGRTNPLLDRNLTCEEMEEVPELAFELTDLGSGTGTLNKVNYRCPKSLSQLDFLQKIINSATEIRGDDKIPNYCIGSLSYALRRYFHFSLAHLGYYPGNYSSHRKYDRGIDYFEEWSYHSLYNRAIYKSYMLEVKKVTPLLSDWYVKNYQVDMATAKEYSKTALKRISGWGFGSYYYNWEPEDISPYTDEAIAGDYTNFLASFSNSSQIQKINSLNRILPHTPDKSIVVSMLNSIEIADIEFGNRSETPLSNAINSPDLLQILLDNGFDPNHQNHFGKTALYYAVQFNMHNSAKILLGSGADVNHKYQSENGIKPRCSGIKRWDRTPLMHAAQHADLKMLQILIQNGADSLAKDTEGSTAYDYAVRERKQENADYLLALTAEK